MSASCGVKITVNGETFEYDSATASQLKQCSGLIRDQLEERAELDPDNTDPLEIQISGQDFGKEEVGIVMDYLAHYNYNPPQFGKIISNTLRENLSAIISFNNINIVINKMYILNIILYLSKLFILYLTL